MTSVQPRELERTIRLVEDDSSFCLLLQELKSVARVGVDTEANSFHAYREKVCLVQFSTEHADWVLDPLAVDPEPLRVLFADSSREVVLHAGEFDVLSLKRDFGFRFTSLFDTQIAAMLLGMGQVGYAALVANFFGVNLKKGQQRSDWGRRPLTSRQLEYAAADTRYLLPLCDELSRLLQEKGRMTEAMAGFERLAAAEPRARVVDPEGYRRLKGFRELDSQGRAILKAVYLVREARASRLNRPAFRILDNETMVRVAEARPLDAEALARVKGVPEVTVQRFAQGILSAVRAGLDDPTPPSLDRPRRKGRAGSLEQLDSSTRERFEMLRAWRNQLALEKGVERQVIARNDVLKEIASAMPASIDELEVLLPSDRFALRQHAEEILGILAGDSKPR